MTFDIAMSNHDPAAFDEAALMLGFPGFGTYSRSGLLYFGVQSRPPKAGLSASNFVHLFDLSDCPLLGSGRARN
jgi:hypothetical protein